MVAAAVENLASSQVVKSPSNCTIPQRGRDKRDKRGRVQKVARENTTQHFPKLGRVQ